MNKLYTPDQFKTRPALIGMGVLGLILAYLLVSRAFDTGSLWQYTVTFIIAFLSIRLFLRAFKSK